MAGFLKGLFLLFFLLSFLAFLYGFLPQPEKFSREISRLLLAGSAIFFSLYLASRLLTLFFNSKLKSPCHLASLDDALREPEKYNLAEFLAFGAAKAAKKAINFSRKRKFAEVPSTALLYFILERSLETNFIFSRALLDLKRIKKELKKHLDGLKGEGFQKNFSQDFQKVITEAVSASQKRKNRFIEASDILIAQSRVDPILKNHLVRSGIKPKDMENLANWVGSLLKGMAERKRFWEWKNLIKRGTLAKELSAGYTLTLDRFSIDISETVKKSGFPEIAGHQKEIEAMERVLTRREKNNVLLVGEPGSGRRSIIYALAARSVLGESLGPANYKRVVQLDLTQILAQTDTSQEAEGVLDRVLREAIAAGNIILVIDEFHNFIGGQFNGARVGAMDISASLAPYLSRSDFQIVAITTFEGLHKNIEQNSSVLSLFEKVEIQGISREETLLLLGNRALSEERKYKKFVSFAALRDTVDLSEKYLTASPLPEKAMKLFDEVMVFVGQTKDKVVLSGHVAKIISEKTQIPIGEIETKEKEILLNMEELMHQRIVNQEEAIGQVSAALRRARTEITVKKGPIGAFLFLGPTGVGKTETSKALAEIYFGSDDRMIRLDMSEFQNVEDIGRLLGSRGEEGILTTPARENPFSLLLLDEIEKAHPNILNLFLQVLDEGRITDGMGRLVDFKNMIIIATSNAGYQIILEALSAKTEWSSVKEKLLNFIFEKGIFRPEFVNRFDAVVLFSPLSKENLSDIAALMLGKLKKNLAEKDIEFIITESLKEKIVELGYDPTFGARNMQRVIQDKVGNVLAKAILSGELKGGSKVEIAPEDFSLKISA